MSNDTKEQTKPLKKKQSISTKTVDVHSQLASKDLHVLVVDDDSLYRKSLSELLNKLGYKATSVEGGKEALLKLKEQSTHNFGIILVDCMMPGMDGFELLRMFKQAYSYDIPSIMISSSKDPNMISKAFQCGVEDFLQKPIGLEMLKTRITMCLEDRLRRQKEKELEIQLDLQRQKNNEHQKIIESFKNEISEKIETPIQAVMKTIGDLMKEDDNSSVKQYKGALIAILKSLGSHDLYKPTFEEIESSTKKWLETEYTSYEDKTIKTSRSKSSSSNGELKGSENSKSLFDLEQWNFDVESKEEGDLIKALFAMYKNLGIVEVFNIDEKKLRLFIIEVKSNYNENPYHNFRHAVDVAQFVYCFLLLPKLKDFFTVLEKFAILTAALCHDLDHPGLNNTFQVNAATELALLYNDISVLENHHCSMAFKLLKNSKANILESLSTDDWNAFRKIFISCILSTDMTHHFEILTKLQTRLKTGPLGTDSKDHQQLANIILKCSDISNVCRPPNVSKMWAEALVQEFLNQGDAEKDKNLPISPLMDRTKMNIAKLQVNFIDYIAGPLFKTITNYLTGMDEVNGYIQKNREIWAEVLKNQPDTSNDDSKQESWISGELDFQLPRIKGFNALVYIENPIGKNQICHILQTRGYSTSIANDFDSCLNFLERDHDFMILELKNNETLNKIEKIFVDSKHRKIPIIGIKNDEKVEKNEKVFKLLNIPTEMNDFIGYVESSVTESQNSAHCLDIKVAIEQSGDDKEFLIELIELFEEECEKQIDLYEKSIKSKEYDEVERIAHSMKGAASQIAAKPLCRAAYQLEQVSKERREISELETYLLILKRIL
eukprot:gene7158-11471_t